MQGVDVLGQQVLKLIREEVMEMRVRHSSVVTWSASEFGGDCKKTSRQSWKTVWISWVKEPLTQQCGATALSSLGDPQMVAIQMQSKTIWPGLSAAVSGSLAPSQELKKTSSVEHVAAAEDRAFAAAKDDGSFFSW